ncbi:SWAHC protein, partial [Amia calva]|nr:SWAHC protein [Amia calva]
MYDSAGIPDPADTISPGAHLYSPLLQEEEEEEEEECGRDAENARDSQVSANAQPPGAFNASRSERPARLAAPALPGALYASARRSKLQRQQEVSESGAALLSVSQKLPGEASEKGSLTPAMRKKYLKELLLNNGLHTGLGSILLSSQTCSVSRESDPDALQPNAEDSTAQNLWALDPLEHAWMLSVVDGNFETIVEFLSEDPTLLTKRDFVTGFTAIHWLAKHGKDETLIKIMRYAESQGFPVNVNLKASGGLTPLHVAAMHGQNMVVKILVGAFSASVEAMDYSGRRAWQYLRADATVEMKELLGAMDDEGSGVGHHNVNNNSTGGEHLSSHTATMGQDQVDSPAHPRFRFSSLKRFFSPLFSFASRDRNQSVE